MPVKIDIVEAAPEDAPEIAEIHLAARLSAMPYLHRACSDEETRSWFAGAVGDRPSAWWVAHNGDKVVGYMLLHPGHLEHLYIQPAWQGSGTGTALLDKAKTLSPVRLALSTFQKNLRARAFYEVRGFHVAGSTDGQNEENEPDVQYVWQASRCD
jgi:ribosomal protein S18 acetylase RimI-like enzyme